MRPSDVEAQVAVIRSAANAGDDEAAHSRESDLYLEVLEAIASGDCRSAKALAAAALKTQELGFERWFA